MNQDETIELFMRCEAAANTVHADAKDVNQANEASQAVWNEWAAPLLAQRQTLISDGKWELLERKDFESRRQ